MFSSFNFVEGPKIEPKISRKDRRFKYLREQSAKNRLAANTEQGPSTSENVDSVLKSGLFDQKRQGPRPKSGISKRTNVIHPIKPLDLSALEASHPGPSEPRRPSRWATVREKTPQMIAREKIKRLDLNKGAEVPVANGAPKPMKLSLGDFVRSTMVLKNWLSAMEHDERESENNDPTTMTNGQIEGDQQAILPDSPDFENRPTGFAQVKEFVKDTYKQVVYLYITENSPFYYYWTCIVAIGVLYNMFGCVIFIFDDVHQDFFWEWLFTNIFFDVCYLLDMIVGSRMSEDGENLKTRKTDKSEKPPEETFNAEGNEVSQTVRMWRNYRSSRRFKVDLLSMVPLDLFLIPYSHVTLISLLRLVKLFKAYRMYDFLVLTERRTDFPHFMKILFLSTACAVLFHWNACVYFLFSLAEGLTEDDTNAFGFSYYKVFDPRFPTCDVYDSGCLYPENTEVLDIRDERPRYMQEMYRYWEKRHTLISMGNFSREYSMTMYWSSLTITKCGQQPWPSTSPQNSLEIFDTLIGVLVFATIIGGVGNVVTQMSQNVNDFRDTMDGIKFYMKYRGVQSRIQERVLSCFLYLNAHNQLFDEKEILSILPPQFQADVAASLHQATLEKVALFENCDQRLLQEVVLLVKQQVYSPNDYLCRKNDKAKEMFIVKKGTLSVIDDDNGAELERLIAGATFGELSIIQMKGNLLGDRRSVSLKSVGYSDVYVLHQDDVSRLLQEYPEERVTLLKNARNMLSSRGLLETTDTNEKCEHVEEWDDEGVLEFMSVDEQLERVENIITDIDKELKILEDGFKLSTNSYKQRVTSLERTYNSNKAKIRADFLFSVAKRRGIVVEKNKNSSK